MKNKTAKEKAEQRLATWIDNAFYDDDTYLANNPEVLKELWKARNRCYKVLGYEPKDLPWASKGINKQTEQSMNHGRD